MEAFDIQGRLVRTLLQSPLSAGDHEIVWDGRDFQGTPLPAGIYFYRLTGAKASVSRKVVLLN